MTAPLRVLALTAVYALALGSVAPADLVIGAGAAVGVLALTRGLVPVEGPRAPETARRLARAPAFALAVARATLRGSWDVARVVLGTRPGAPGIVAVPIGQRTPAGVAVTAFAVTLSPGEALVDVDWDERVMIVHVIDASDPDSIRAEYRRFYERYQRELVP